MKNKIIVPITIGILMIDAYVIGVSFYNLDKRANSAEQKAQELQAELEIEREINAETLTMLAQMRQQLDAANIKIDELEAYVQELEDARIILDDNEKEALLKIAKVEAGGQGVKGKAHVMRVVLNRVEHETKYPDNVQDVIEQSGQFSPVESGSYYVAVPDAECYEALKAVEAGWDETMGATNFRAGGYHNFGTPLYQYKDHFFSK